MAGVWGGLAVAAMMLSMRWTIISVFSMAIALAARINRSGRQEVY